MKLVMDEKLKHRLIGLAVVISLGAIFAPAMLLKSNKNLDKLSVHIALPPKPAAPDVVVTDEKELFKTVKVARVDIPAIPTEQELPLAQNDSVAELPPVEPEIVKIAANSKTKALKPKNNTYAKPKHKTLPLKTTRAPASQAYTVQLASFSKLTNAQLLVNQIQKKGYKAQLAKINTKQGLIYKVSVGRSANKAEVLHLKQQLASLTKLNGFIAPANGVS